MGKPVRVVPTSWEVANGLLRRTPFLQALEMEGVLVLNVEGRQVSLEPTADRGYYEASELYALSPKRPVYRFWVLPTREVRVTCGEPEPRSFFRSPSPPEPGEAEEKPLPPKRKVVLEQRNGEWKLRETLVHSPPHLEAAPPSEGKAPVRGKPEPAAPSTSPSRRHPQEALPLLLELLGQEEFAPEGVDPVLEHRGFRPEEVWRWLEAHGLVEKEAGFMRLKRRQGAVRGGSG